LRVVREGGTVGTDSRLLQEKSVFSVRFFCAMYMEARMMCNSCARHDTTTQDARASAIIPSSKCYSIIGPIKKVSFGDAAIIWASFYHLMFSVDEKKMKRSRILPILKKSGEYL
jgi:hypothetical protein